MAVCRLCFEKVVNTIGIFDASGIELNMAQIIGIHFPDEVTEDDPLPKCVCLKCWIRLKYFHEFYNAVAEAKSSYLRNASKDEEPAFMQVTVDPIDVVESVPFVKLEPEVAEESVGNAASQEYGDFETGGSEESFENVVEVTNMKRDSRIEEASAEMVELTRRIIEKADKTSIESVTTKRKANKEFTKMIPQYVDLSCEMCKYRGTSLNTICTHYRVKHAQRKITAKCCQRKISTSYIRDHILRHLNPHLLKCDECGRYFHTIPGLKVHLKTHDLKTSSFECDICKKTLKGRRNLINHMVSSHGRDKGRFGCEICKKRFNRKHILGRHIKITHENYRYECQECGNEYTTKVSLQNHMLAHGGVQRQRWECQLCPSTFSYKYSLPAHMKTHQDGNKIEQTFQCPYCSEEMPNRRELKRHMITVHNFRGNTCHLCGRDFVSPMLLKGHIKLHTNGSELLKCDYCTEEYKGYVNVRKHMRKFHPSQWNADQQTQTNDSNQC